MAEEQKRSDDPDARASFGMRRMTRKQVWALTIVSIAIVIALVAYTEL